MHSTSWRFDLRRFDDDPPKPPSGDPPKPDPDPKPDPKGDDKPPDKAFTEADVNRIVADRLKRQKDQYGDVDDLRKKAAEFDKLQDASKSDLEKAQAAAVKAEEAREKAITTANERLVRAEAIAAAAAAGFNDPTDAVALMDRSEVAVDEDGNVAGVTEAVTALAAAKPHLVGSRKPHPGGGDGGARPPGGAPDFRTADKDTLAAELAKHGLRVRS